MLSMYNPAHERYAQEHYQAILSYVQKNDLRAQRFSNLDFWIQIVSNNLFDLKKIITATPSELKQITTLLSGVAINRDANLIKHIYKTCFSSSTAKSLTLNNDNYSSYHFVKRLGIKV